MKQCPKCRVLFRDKRKFRPHLKDCLILETRDAISMQRDHSPKRETTPSIQSSQSTGTEKQRLQCPHCPKTFTLKENCHYHVEQKHSENPERIQCPYCLMTFSTKGCCQRHVKQQHSDDPLRFPCTMCDKVLASNQSLRLHRETVHSTLPPCHICWYCSATFTRKTDSRRHT